MSEIKTWSALGKALGLTVNTLRAWRSESDSPKTKDLDTWKQWIAANKTSGEGKGSGRITVDGETFSAEDIRKFKAQYQKAIAIKEEFNGKIRELEYRQKVDSLIPEAEAAEKMIKVLTPLRRLLDSLPRQVAAIANPAEPQVAELAIRNFLDDRIFSEIVKIIEQDEGDNK